MPDAIRAKDLKQAEEADLPQDVRDKRTRSRARRRSLRGSTFEDLNVGGRNSLLKEVAIKLGLIQDSEDS